MDGAVAIAPLKMACDEDFLVVPHIRGEELVHDLVSLSGKRDVYHDVRYGVAGMAFALFGVVRRVEGTSGRVGSCGPRRVAVRAGRPQIECRAPFNEDLGK